MMIDPSYAQNSDGQFDWVRMITDSIENKTDLCTACNAVPPEMRSYIAPGGELRFRLHYSCGLFDAASLNFNSQGEFIGGCIKDSTQNDCEEFNLSVSYTFGRDLTTVWACDVGYNCIDVNRFDLFQPYEVIVLGDPCLDSVQTLQTTTTFRSYEWTLPNGSTLEDDYITVNQSGSYQLILTNHDGCMDTIMIEVDLTEQIANSIIGSNFICDDAGTRLRLLGYDNYQWSTGASGSEIEVYEEGLYSVDACKTNGCCDTFSIEIYDHGDRAIVISGYDETIYTGQEVSLILELGGIRKDEIDQVKWWTNDQLLSKNGIVLSINIPSRSSVLVELTTTSGCIPMMYG